MPNVVSNTLSLIGGAVVGAAAMYLLDPDLGEDRRRDVKGTAAGAVSSTRQAVGTTIAGASDSAHSVANMISQYARDLASRVGEQVSDTADSLSDSADEAVGAVRSAREKAKARIADVVDSATSYGRGVVKGASKRAHAAQDDWADRASSLLGRARAAGRRAAGIPEPRPVARVAGVTVGSLGVLAVGAALMYFLDPARGRSRRALVRDKVYSVTRTSGDKVRRYGHHLGNKAQGYAAQARNAVPEQWVEKAKSVVSGSGDGATSPDEASASSSRPSSV